MEKRSLLFEMSALATTGLVIFCVIYGMHHLFTRRKHPRFFVVVRTGIFRKRLIIGPFSAYEAVKWNENFAGCLKLFRQTLRLYSPATTEIFERNPITHSIGDQLPFNPNDAVTLSPADALEKIRSDAEGIVNKQRAERAHTN